MSLAVTACGEREQESRNSFGLRSLRTEMCPKTSMMPSLARMRLAVTSCSTNLVSVSPMEAHACQEVDEVSDVAWNAERNPLFIVLNPWNDETRLLFLRAGTGEGLAQKVNEGPAAGPLIVLYRSQPGQK